MSGLPTWKRVRTIRGTTCHEWGCYAIEGFSGKWYLYANIGGLDSPLGTHTSFEEAKEAAYENFRLP